MKLTDIVPDLTLHGDCDLELARRVYLGEGVWGRLREGRNPAVWSKVSTPCALWTHQPDGKTHGYGKFHHKRRRRLAHREVYKLFVGPIPPGWDVDHMCGQAECVRPDHLRRARRPSTDAGIQGETCISGLPRSDSCRSRRTRDNVTTSCSSCRPGRKASRRIRSTGVCRGSLLVKARAHLRLVV